MQIPNLISKDVLRATLITLCPGRSVVFKMVDINPQGSIGPSKGLINSHEVEWGSLNDQGVNE